MQFSNDDSIKGDFDVEATGVDSVMADEVLSQRVVQWGAMMQQNPDTAKTVNWTKFGRLSGKLIGVKDEGLMYSDAEVKSHDDAAAQQQAAIEQAKQNQTQPAMSEKDWLLKVLERIPENSPMQAPMVRMTLTAGKSMTPEMAAAINGVSHVNAEQFSSQLTPSDQALLEHANATVSANPGESQLSGNSGTGVPSGGPTPG
jgi:hypothetical protein